MFKTQDNGTVLWLPTTEDECTQFILGLDSNIAPKPDLAYSIESRLESIAKRTLDGSKNLVDSNRRLYSTLEKIVHNPGVVDIVMPVYGSLKIVSQSIDSILTRTNWPFKLIIVDDCSPDEKTREWLRAWRDKHPEHEVLFNKSNRGFASTVNRGMRHGKNKFVCVMNSDVLVTPRWLTKMVMALKSDDQNCMVVPTTNDTALIAVPFQAGMSYLDMNKGLELFASRRYPEIMPTGMCLLFKRTLLDEIGYLDEAYGSYGEDSDFHMRAVSYISPSQEFKKYKAVIADDAYVYHERSSSFSSLGESKHMQLRKVASERFHSVWPQFKSWRQNNKVEEKLEYLKRPIPSNTLDNNPPYNVAFLVFSSAFCGGMAFITDIVNELIEKGVNAKVVQLWRDPKYKPVTMGELRTGVVHFPTPADMFKDFGGRVFDKGVIIAATAEMVPFTLALNEKNKALTPVLFAQSYDVALAPTQETRDAMGRAYAAMPHIITGSLWLDEAIRGLTKRSTLGWVRPGVDSLTFYPRERNKGDDRPTVGFMLNAKDPYRGFDRGMMTAKALRDLAQGAGMDLRMLGIGIGAIKGAEYVTCVGEVSQGRLAGLLGREIDILVDPCFVHGYGMPGAEAMASGVVPACWDNQGINEYGEDGKNALIVPREAKPEELANRIFKALSDPGKLQNMKNEAKQFTQSREEGVKGFITILEHQLDLSSKKLKINVVTPHLRKHGGPTTILDLAHTLKDMGHEVGITSIYPDINPEIVKTSTVPISMNWQAPEPCDVVIVNSDNPHTEHFANLTAAKKKVLLKLSHNPRFKELEDKALHQKWDAIVTSTNWLVEACEKPMEGWTHPPQKATRVGWYHYGHKAFDCPPTSRSHFNDKVVNVYTLIHHHPLKGANEALNAMSMLKAKYGDEMKMYGVGEWPDFAKNCPKWLNYLFSPNRETMAQFLKGMDIFISSSHTEGLGRMALEAMSSSVVVVKSDTHCEFARSGENCLVVPSNKPEDLMKGVEDVLVDLSIFSKLAAGGYNTACRYADNTVYKTNLRRVLKGL